MSAVSENKHYTLCDSSICGLVEPQNQRKLVPQKLKILNSTAVKYSLKSVVHHLVHININLFPMFHYIVLNIIYSCVCARFVDIIICVLFAGR